MNSDDPRFQHLREEIRRLEQTYGALLDECQAARLLGASRRTLQGWRARRFGPPFFKLGTGKTALVRYPSRFLRRYMAEHLICPGSPAGFKETESTEG